MRKLWVLAGLLLASVAGAGQVEVKFVRMSQTGSTWLAAVTLRHHDTGWSHYANAWRVVGENGKVYGTRILYHPHEHEQPFTRSLGGIRIPKGVTKVIIEARDKVHGWSADKVAVDLTKASGDRFKVERR